MFGFDEETLKYLRDFYGNKFVDEALDTFRRAEQIQKSEKVKKQTFHQRNRNTDVEVHVTLENCKNVEVTINNIIK